MRSSAWLGRVTSSCYAAGSAPWRSESRFPLTVLRRRCRKLPGCADAARRATLTTVAHLAGPRSPERSAFWRALRGRTGPGPGRRIEPGASEPPAVRLRPRAAVQPESGRSTALSTRYCRSGLREADLRGLRRTARSGGTATSLRAVVRRRYRPGAVGHVFRKPTLTSPESSRPAKVQRFRAERPGQGALGLSRRAGRVRSSEWLGSQKDQSEGTAMLHVEDLCISLWIH